MLKMANPPTNLPPKPTKNQAIAVSVYPLCRRWHKSCFFPLLLGSSTVKNVLFQFQNHFKCLKLKKVETFLFSGDCWGVGDILFGVCWLWVCGGEFEHRQDGVVSRNCNCLGTCCDGHDLLCWSHLWRPFQSCCHHCFCYYQEVSMETGELIKPTYDFFFS